MVRALSSTCLRSSLRRMLICAAVTVSLAAAYAPAQQRVSLTDGLPWRCIGPAVMGGRIDDVAVVESDPAIAYVATATAGLWKTTNHGTTFEPVFDDQPCQSIGAVAVCQSNPNIVWVGTGEANNRQSSSWGCGVFKSTDGGRTWEHMGLEDTLHIARIVIHPRDPEIVFVAAVGHLWGPNKERGLFRTRDGGKTWQAVLQINEDTGCTDVALDPINPDTVFAAMYQRRRAAWGFIGGGPHSGIFRSRDGGDTWQKLTEGLPAGDKGRIGLDVYRKDPRIVYAVVEARDGGVFRSEDGGDTWRRMSSTNPRPMYFSLIRVDPTDDQFVWLAGVSLLRSKDGGRSFSSEPTASLHADIHAIWINPSNPRHMLVGCDGGIQWSHDRGRTWDHVNTIPLAQFYALAHDMETPYNVAGGLQDNGSWIGPSSLPAGRGPSHGDWTNIGGGDGFYCAIDWLDPNTVYSESQNGAVRRLNLATRASKQITPVAPPGEPRYRWDWCTPFMLSPHNPRKVLLGGNRLFISTDRGDTWRRTEDLSTNPNISEFVLMGVKRGTGYPFPDIGSDYGQIVTLTESPVRPGVIYVGTDDGNLQVSLDDGRTWRNVAANVPGVPRGTYVSRVHASPHAAGRVYASFDGHRSDDYRPYIFVSEDYGETWRAISRGIPVGSTVNVVRDHPRCPDLLFAGTDRGLYVSFDRGENWTRFGKPLPPLRVDEVLVHPRENDLIVATHARGVYILDDISVLVAEASRKPGAAMLLPPRRAVQYRGTGGSGSLTGNRQFFTRGAPTGALIRYWLEKEPTEDAPVTLIIQDARGREVLRRRLLTASAGYNLFTWDMRAVPRGRSGTPTRTTQRQTTSGQRQTSRTTETRGQQTGATAMGVRVPPGEYVVRLRVGDNEQSQMLRIDPDPRLRLRTTDYRRVFDTAMGLMTAAMDLRTADARMASLEQSLSSYLSSDDAKAQPQARRAPVSDLLARVRQVRADIAGSSGAGQPSSAQATAGSQAQPAGRSVSLITTLLRYASDLDSAAEAPSPALRKLMNEALGRARGLIAAAETLEKKELPKLNAALKRSGLKPIGAVGSESEAATPDEADQEETEVGEGEAEGR